MAKFDENGLQVDRLADILEGMSSDLRTSFGDSVDLDTRSPIGIILGIVAERYYLLHELLESVYLASFPATAFGVYLDYLCALVGIKRRPAVGSTVSLVFTRSNPVSEGAVEIPKGTTVKLESGSAESWLTDEAVSIFNNDLTTTVQATCDTVGPITAAPDTLVFMTSPPANVLSVTNPLSANPGQDEETDAELRQRYFQSLGTEGTPTQLGITTALRGLDDIQTASVIVNDTDLTIDGRPPHCFEAYISPLTSVPLGNVYNIVFDAEPTAGDVLTVTVNGGALGEVTITNNISDSLTDLATLLTSSPQIASSEVVSTTVLTFSTSSTATVDVVITGESNVVSLINADNGLITRVSQTLWDTKAAGIRSFGDITGFATDVDGNSRQVNFSTISPINVYVRYTLTVKSVSDYLSTYNNTIADAVDSYASLNFTAGVDVLNYRLVCIAADLNISDILGISVEASTDGVSWSTANTVIDPENFAYIPSSNVTFQPLIEG